MKKYLLTTILFLVATLGFAQRFTDKIDRGLIVVPCVTGGELVSWRVLGEEYYDVTYNVYRGTTCIAKNLKVSNYVDTSGSASSKYSVAAVVRGVEQERCAQVTPWSSQRSYINLTTPKDRNGNDVGDDYSVNDTSLGDVDGDGVVEFLVKRPCSKVTDLTNKTEFHHLDMYDTNGKLLWWIDLGPNMLAGADEQWDAVMNDWDEDGKAEVILRIEDNAYIHFADGTTELIGDASVDTRWSGIEYTSTGNEYLLYLEGATGKPYKIGPTSHPDYMDYPNPRGTDSDWGTGIVGHRSTKHYFGAPYLDGRHPSIFLGRGCYTKHMFKAFDVDPTSHQLTQRWEWNSALSGPWFGQGYHNFAIGDADWDGKDEIIFGSMVIDDNGKGLSTTGLGHGDSQHCSDFDPYRKYEEQFACNEDQPAMNYRNAVTSQLYYRKQAGSDDGRALCGNFTNDYPGSVGRSTTTGWISTVADKEVSALGGDAFIGWADLNSRIYWDGDLCDEYMDSPGTAGSAVVYKPATGYRLLAAGDGALNNSSKNNPCAQADIFGDWREELVLRGNNQLVIAATNYPTDYRIPTLWSDHQYRNAMVWQTMGYNQTPHKSYFLGEMEGITQAPPTNTMTNRTEVANGGSITSTDEHLIVCEFNDTQIDIQDGAAPYMVTFYVPSNVEGTSESGSTSQAADINYSYYTCNVTGGALTGSMRLVKQGDGILNLPKVDMTYTGETNIWNGTLNFDGTMKQSDVWLNRFAELNSNGGEFKSLKADYGSIIRPGGADTAGEITVDETLNLGFGSRIELDLYSDGLKADKINAKTINIEKKNWTFGPQYLVPVIEVKEHMTSGETTLAAGEYIIGKVDSLSGSLSTIKVEGVTTLRSSLYLDDNNNLILSLGNVRGASEVVWTGSTSNAWDYAKTQNFYLAEDEAQTPDFFVGHDIVNFTDDASQFNVSISDDLPADSIFVNSSKAYTFAGSGKITSGSFTKEGTGTVTMSNDNTYSGGNYLKGGTVKVSALSNSVTSYGNLGAVTANSAKFTMENGAVLQNTATVTNGSALKMKGVDGGVIYCGAGFTQEKSISGTLLTKKGTGSLTMNTANTSLAKLVIAAGSVSAANVAAKAVEFQGSGSANGAGFLTVPINVAAGATAYLNTVNRSTSSNKLTGTGQIDIFCATEKGSNYYATRSPMQFNLSAFEGTLMADASYIADGRFTFSTANGGTKWTLNIPTGIIVQNHGLTLRIGKLTGTGTLGGKCTFSNSESVGNNTWNVGNEDDFKFEGVFTSADTFNKYGTGKMTTTKAWTSTGAINVREGELHINSGANLGTGALTVFEGATLSGTSGASATTAAANPLTNSSITINGTIQAGTLATSATGILDFGGKNVTIGATGAFRTILRTPGTAEGKLGASGLENIGTLKFTDGSKISCAIYSTYTPQVGDEIRIFTGVATVTGTPTVVCDNDVCTFDTSKLSEGILIVKSIATSITDIPADEVVSVNVISANGTRVDQFTCPMGEVNAKFAASKADKGVYILSIIGKTARGSKKITK